MNNNMLRKKWLYHASVMLVGRTKNLIKIFSLAQENKKTFIRIILMDLLKKNFAILFVVRKLCFYVVKSGNPNYSDKLIAADEK